MMQFLLSAADESRQVASGSHDNGTVENSSLLPYIQWCAACLQAWRRDRLAFLLELIQDNLLYIKLKHIILYYIGL